MLYETQPVSQQGVTNYPLSEAECFSRHSAIPVSLLLGPCTARQILPHGKAAPMFVLSEVARKRYAQFQLNFGPSVSCEGRKTDVKLGSLLEPKALPASALERLDKKFRPLIDRVMARLSEAEQREINTHLKADYRQSWICLSFANRGIADPFVSSSYQMYGIHPSKVWELIVADRKARLGADYYDWYTSDDLLRPDVPKIPPKADDVRTANGADALPQAIGPVPQRKEVV